MDFYTQLEYTDLSLCFIEKLMASGGIAPRKPPVPLNNISEQWLLIYKCYCKIMGLRTPQVGMMAQEKEFSKHENDWIS